MKTYSTVISYLIVLMLGALINQQIHKHVDPVNEETFRLVVEDRDKALDLAERATKTAEDYERFIKEYFGKQP